MSSVCRVMKVHVLVSISLNKKEVLGENLIAPTFKRDGFAELDLYPWQEKVYTRSIKGHFQRLRLYTGWPLLMAYFVLPWCSWRGHPIVLLDIPERKFHLFGVTYWPQDFPLLAALLIIAAFLLFAVTNFLGRVWCGYTCPQTVWTAVFMWAEQFCEGSRNQRIKRDKSPLSLDKVWRKVCKHGMWLGFALLTGVTFVGYFYPIGSLILEIGGGLCQTIGLCSQPGSNSVSLVSWSCFWVLFFMAATYINAGWLMEQVCLYMCPYARFQSAMFDKDTLIVSYNKSRGESRGARKRNEKPNEGLGDCIDCKICVQVCPTGIDIRNGLQVECINCALCIDACNSVMRKMQYPLNLISYTTENTLAGKPSKFFRPRLLAYVGVLSFIVLSFIWVLLTRETLTLDIKKDRQQLYTEQRDGSIENTYVLKLINKEHSSHTFDLTVLGLEGVRIIGSTQLNITAGEVKEFPVRLRAEKEAVKLTVTAIQFFLQATDSSGLTVESDSRFIGPMPRKQEQ